jgi:hypothetical protein
MGKGWRAMSGYLGSTACYKLTKTAASRGVARIVDAESSTDMHTLLPGVTYNFSCYVYVPSTGGPTSTEVNLDIGQYYSAAWNETQDTATTQDAWEKLEIEWTMSTAATGFAGSIEISSQASTGEFIYVDNVRLYEAGITNAHECNFRDEGTRTYLH